MIATVGRSFREGVEGVGRAGSFVADSAGASRDVRTWLPLAVAHARTLGVDSLLSRARASWFDQERRDVVGRVIADGSATVDQPRRVVGRPAARNESARAVRANRPARGGARRFIYRDWRSPANRRRYRDGGAAAEGDER